MLQAVKWMPLRGRAGEEGKETDWRALPETASSGVSSALCPAVQACQDPWIPLERWRFLLFAH